jgi:hypothetical protein
MVSRLPIDGFELDTGEGAAGVVTTSGLWNCGPTIGFLESGNRAYRSDVDWGTRGLGSAEEAMDWVEAHLPAKGRRHPTFPGVATLMALKLPIDQRTELVSYYAEAGYLTPGQVSYILERG